MGYDAPSPALPGNERAHPFAVALVAIAGVLAIGVFGAVVVRFAGADSRAADRLTGPPPAPVAAVPSAPVTAGSPASATAGPSASVTGTPPEPARSGSPGAGPSAVVTDECLLGAWSVAEQRELVALPGIGTVAVTLTGSGPVVSYEDAGTGVVDYGTATAYAATVDGREALITVAGVVTFEFAAADGRTAATEARSAATFTVTTDGGGTGAPEDWPASLTEWAFDCGPGELSLTGADSQRALLVRDE